MRVKLENRIKLARNITHREGSNLFLVTTFFHEELYTVKVNKSQEEIEKIWTQILTLGYVDFSDCEYSN